MTTSVAVRERVHVYFGRLFQELIDQYRPRRAHERCLRDIFLHSVHVIGDHHGAATQHVTRPHQHRQTNFGGNARRLFGHQRGRVSRLRDSQFLQQAAEAPPIFGQVDRFRSRADDGHAVALQLQRQVQRRLPAELHDHALGLLALDNRQHVLQCERLEVQTIGGVVVGGDRLRIAIHHDRFVAVFAQRKRRVAAAVVELDALSDTIGAAAENHDLRARLHVGLVFFFVRRIHVRREGLELRRASIDALENRCDAVTRALQSHSRRGGLPNLREVFVAGAVALDFAQQVARSGFDGHTGRAPVHGVDFFELLDKPRIDFRQLANLSGRQPALNRRQQPMNAVRPRRCQLLPQQVTRVFPRAPARECVAPASESPSAAPL